MDKIENQKKVGFWLVAKAFWRAMRAQKGSMLFTMFSFSLSSVFVVFIPLLYKHFFDILTTDGLSSRLAPILVNTLIAILAINMFNMVLMRVTFLVLNDFESKTMARIKQISFDYMMHHSYSFFTNNFTGSLVQRISRFGRAFERLYDTIVFQIIPLSINILGSLIVVWFQKPLISKIMLIWIILIMIFNFFFFRWKVKYDVLSTKADSTTTGVLSDDVTNHNAIMLFDNYEKESLLFKETTNAQAKAQRLSWNLSGIADGFQILFIGLVEFLIFYFAVKYWQVGTITVGTFVLLQTYILGLSQRLWDFGRIIRNFNESFADSKEMVEILELPHEIKDVQNAQELQVKAGNISFKDVSFGFNETRKILHNFNLDIKEGEKVALIGPSGAGKSTIIKILLRMHDLISGAILVDGQDIKHITQGSLRENISLVPQDPVLFHRSLKENIRYGKPEASDEEVIEAARQAHCDEFINQLPLKYDTLVGERGIKLSGGERQRIAIARAILKNAPILILDEATSSLDSHSESLIQDALDKLMNGKTSIVIAHRLSTIRKMDRIVVIEDGKVKEDGNHESLLQNDSGLYKKLWNLQAGGFLTA